MDIIMGCDSNNISEDRVTLQKMAKILRDAGHTVKTVPVGPSPLQNACKSSSASGKVAVFIVNGADLQTYKDFHDGISRGYYHVSHCYFALEGWISKDTCTCSGATTAKLNWVADGVAPRSYVAELIGMTTAEVMQKYPECDYACGSSFEELSQNLVSVLGGQVNSSSDYGTQQGDSALMNPMLSGERTFQDIIGDICNGLDILFLCKRNMVVVTDFESIYNEAQEIRDKKKVSSSEDIKLWQIEDGSYEVDVNQFGFYNTVYVKYSNGVVKEQYNDLVAVYGEHPITYKEPKLSKTQAIRKAKTYLAAHVREFSMTMGVSLLHDGDIDVGDIVTLDNPHMLHNTGKNQEFYFVKGVGVEWDEGPIQVDLELEFSPESPDHPEIPEAGTGGYSPESSSGNVGSDCWNKYWDIAKNSVWSHNYSMSNPHDPAEAYKVFGENTSKKQWDCYSSTAWLYYVLNFKCNVPARDVVGAGSGVSGTHHVIQVKQGGEWIFPPEQSEMPSGLTPTSAMKAGHYHVSRAPPSDMNNPSSYPGYQNPWYGNHS